jgi:tripartite-type tricarboxylate transporter receptor subunit TctC
MMPTLSRRLFTAAILVAGSGAALAPSKVLAQTYPNRTISLVVPFAAGGPSDVISRLIGVKMSEKLGQQIIIENIVGAGGTVAPSRVSKQPADGYTLMIHHVALPLGAALYKNLSYETATAFEPLGLVNFGPYVLTTKADYPANTPQELFASFKANTDKITFAHAGIGSGSHLCGIMLMQAVGFKGNFVAYRGTGPALNDVVAGQVDILCDQTTNTFPQIEAGKIKAFATTAPVRNPKFPNIPTTMEIGLPNLDTKVWHALYAPKGVPTDILDKLNAALQFALDDKLVQTRFEELGTDLYPANQRSRAEHAKLLASELKRMMEIAQSAGIVGIN